MRNLILKIALLLSTSISAQAETILWEQTGFEMPESAIVLHETGNIVLSNIKGHPMKVDGNGYLSLISKDGKIINQKWVVGMDAPKGIARLGNQLLVADLTKLHIVDIETGTITQSHNAKGSVFLNDITTDGKSAWITDFMKHTIWKYQDGELELWLKEDALSHPNGILFDNHRLVIGTWGEGIQDDFSTNKPGQLISVDLATKAITKFSKPIGNIDGVVKHGDNFIVNDWINGKVFEVNKNGDFKELFQKKSGLADISINNNILLSPMMLEGKLQAIDLSK
ncbi:MAG: hypothetical protein COC17_06615 [Hyphomicrobiales bacterium]|nr:MAG: hypothetical protein COC17_06615 [Hyphomicrobiales bacterium]